MKLVAFRIQNYRSINDSGEIEVRSRTALVGRNESGKTNLLLALRELVRPDRQLKDFSFVKDFPRDRTRDEYSPDTPVIWSKWKLSPKEINELQKIFPPARDITQIIVTRSYSAKYTVELENFAPISLDIEWIKGVAKKGEQAFHKAIDAGDPEQKEHLLGLFAELLIVINDDTNNATQWAEAVTRAIQKFKSNFNQPVSLLPDATAQCLDELSAYVQKIQTSPVAYQKACDWILSHLPIFIYLDEYPVLPGHQNIVVFNQRRRQNTPLTPEEENFKKLLKVAGLDPTELEQLLGQNHEERQLHTNRASATVTKKIRQLWTDRSLKVRFALDADHFDTLISDPTSFYDVEVNLDERSRGFKWFFSFYITFTADTSGGSAEDAIILLDEPGLFLHGKAQEDLLQHFAQDFQNQIIFTTHSPFMVPMGEIASVRTVNISPEMGTTVTNDPTGDERTLFPLRISMGYEIAQSLFIGQYNIVVEGITDYWYLSSVSDYLQTIGKPSLPSDLILTPAGGAGKVGYMVTLLAAHRLKALVLIDSDNQGTTVATDMLKAKIIRDKEVIYAGQGLGTTGVEADLEDLIDPSVFAALVDETYEKELKGKTLVLNAHVPRIVKRYEEAFAACGLEFFKTRPAKLFLRRIVDNPSSLMTATTEEHFIRLIEIINQKYQTLINANRAPFS